MLDSLYIALIAFTYSELLTREGMLLNKLWCWFEDKWYGKPIITCPLCVAGQIGLWSGFLMQEWTPEKHLIRIFLSIFFTHIITLLNDKIETP